MAIPGLPDGARARVYARIVDQLMTAPVLSSVVKTWTHGIQAKGGSTVVPNAATATHFRLVPQPAAADWYSPDAQLGDLEVRVEFMPAGAATGAVDMLDLLNLWEAVENAFYPFASRDKRLAVENDLKAAGSLTGQVLFSRPAAFVGTDPESGRPIALGSLRIDVIRGLNP